MIYKEERGMVGVIEIVEDEMMRFEDELMERER
jgi:hypothetical protein